MARTPSAAIARVLRSPRRLRLLGVDDAPFGRGGRGPVLVLGAVYSAQLFEGLLSTQVRQDGRNATERLVAMIGASKFRDQLHAVLLDGVTMAGFNVVDLPHLAGEVDLPCLAVMRQPPDLDAVRAALTHLPGGEWRWRVIRRAGPVHRSGKLWFQVAGLAPDLAARLLERSVFTGHYPECLRGAHLIGGGLVLGESGRRA